MSDTYAEFAKAAADKDVRIAALRKITDEDTLINIAKFDSDKDVRIAAVSKIINEASLTEIIKNAHYSDASQMALEKIADESILISFAKTRLNSDLCRSIYNRLRSNKPALTLAEALKTICDNFEHVFCKDQDDLFEHVYSDDKSGYTCTRCGYENVNKKLYCDVHGHSMKTLVTEFQE